MGSGMITHLQDSASDDLKYVSNSTSLTSYFVTLHFQMWVAGSVLGTFQTDNHLWKG